MARYTGPVCRLCRREGVKLFLKGDRCYSSKCAMEKRAYPPGQHGQRRSKVGEYGMQLREKQKARRIYGINEKPFANYFDEAERLPGVTGETLILMLEHRFDNVVYRLGFADSRAQARQMVRHNHFTLNGKKANIPSISLKVGDEIAFKASSAKSAIYTAILENLGTRAVPTWLELDVEGRKARVVAEPKREDIDIPVNEQMIVEFYNK